ncbi:MAG: hypothetical protein BJ554DRAFT_5156, partial [Olpidium bornovanus]
HHPDKKLGSEDDDNKFKEVAEAYEVLSDPQKRRRHDMGADFEDGCGFGGMAGGCGPGATFRFGEGSDFMQAFFGGAADPLGGMGGAGGHPFPAARRNTNTRDNTHTALRTAGVIGIEAGARRRRYL